MVSGHPLALWEKRPPKPARAVVLLHGRTWSSLPDFDLQVAGEQRSLMDALVAKGYAVYALDLRGYGATPRDRSGWNSPGRAAADLAAALAWVAANGSVPGKPVLFGWSNGATVAQLCAQRYPARMSDLILFGYWKDPDVEIAPVADTITPLREKTTAEAAASDFIAPNAISKRAIRAYVAAALAADPVRADWRRLEEYNALDPALVRVPTLLIQGELDPLAPTDALARFFGRLANPDRQWVVIPGGDHAALLEDMQPAFVAAMVSFIERPRWKP
jgi:pimeloyl-ACP methyl ester carboxylesterase